MFSFWEKQSLLKYDAIIVGGGIVGLSAAAALKENNSKLDVLLLERGIFPSGASTKNAGFACFGSPTELLSDLKTLSEEEVVALVQQRWNGLLALQKRLGRKQIGLLNHGGYEVVSEAEVYCLEHLDRLNSLLAPVFEGQVVYEQTDNLLNDFQFGPSVKHLVKNHFEAQIDTGRMMKSLLNYVSRLGVTILTGCEVEAIEQEGNRGSVQVKGMDGGFLGKQIGVCTNAFTQKLMGDKLPQEIKPGRGLVLATKPIPGLPFKGVFHLDEGFFYFRNHGERVIFGGGRNLDFEGEQTTDFGVNSTIYKVLTEKLKEVILPNYSQIEITDVWSGIMGFGKDKQPIAASVSPSIHLAVRLGGMGVAIGSSLGEQLAETLQHKL